MTPLSVALVAQPSDGGVAICVRDLAVKLAEDGIDVRVVCNPTGWLAEQTRAARLRTVSVRMERRLTVRDVLGIRALRHALAGADLIHLHSTKAGFLGRLASIGLGVPVVYSPHGWAFLMSSRMARIYWWVERLLVYRTAMLIAVSEEEATYAERLVKRRRTGVRVIFNGVDTRRFAPTTSALERQDTLLCVGRLTHQKGQDLLIRAVAVLGEPVRLVLVGDGPDRHRLEDLARTLRVNAEFVGNVADTRPYLESATIVCVPSRWDGMSLAMLEAMASGKAIIASQVPGTEALAGVGLITPPNDVEALGAAIRQLLASPTSRAELGRLARERACASFDLSHSLDQTVRLLREIA